MELIEQSAPYRAAVFSVLKRRDLAAFVEQETGTKLTPNGDDYSGWCPLHSGTHPTSFGVTQTSEGVYLFHCLGCQASGTIIDFWMALKKIEFPVEAALELCDKLGLTNDEVISGSIAGLRVAHDADRSLENLHIQIADLCHVVWARSPNDPTVVEWIDRTYRRLNAALASKNKTELDEIRSEALRKL